MDQPGMIDQRPLPARTEASAPYWDGLRAGEIRIPRCGRCDWLQYPPDLTCWSCGSIELRWERCSGWATLYSWTIAHPPLLPFFAEHGTWAVAAVELEEGPRMIATVHGVDPSEYRIGMPLGATFHQVADDITLVGFEPLHMGTTTDDDS